MNLYKTGTTAPASLAVEPRTQSQTQRFSDLEKNRLRQSQILIVLVLSAFGWRMVGLTNQSLWRDEVDVIFLAIRPLSETLSMFVSPAQNGPLYYLLIRPWLFWAGSSEFALRYSSVLLGTLSVPLLWQVARRLLPGDGRLSLDNAPLLAALFLAFNPYQIWYSQEGKMYALVMCLTLVASWSWLEAMRHGGKRRWLRYLVWTSISIYSHLMTALMIPLHFAWFLLAWPLSRQRWRGYLATLAGLILPYVPLVWWQWHYLTSADYSTGYAFTPFGEVIRALLLHHARGVFSQTGLIWLVPVLFLVLAGLLMGATELSQWPGALGEPHADGIQLPLGSWQRLGLVASWLLLPVLLIHGISLVKPIFVDRYVIWIASAFVMLLALGIRVVRRSSGRWATPVTVALLTYVLVFWLQSGWEQVKLPHKTQLREAVTYVAAHRRSDQLLILQIPHTHFAYRYYTSDFGRHPFQDSESRLAPWAEGEWTQNDLPAGEAASQVDRSMQGKTAGYQDIWVILTEANSWDSRRLMDDWLEKNGQIVDQQIFHGIEVREYELN